MPASERYRTHDGTCNNRRRQRWGASQMPFSRFLPPEYGDGVDSVRKSVDGGTLSSSRFVSLLVHGAREGEAPLTLMLAQWGQLLDHDLTSTAQPRSINGSVPSCCGNKDFHPSCFPIKVPLDDPWLSSLKVRCLEFLRSAPAQRRDCVLSWREQTNQATSFIDASPIYSNSVKSSDSARIFRNGLLIFGRGNPNEDVCQRGAIATNCIRSGDGRSGEQPGLLALHHVWVGEHNHIAMRLSEMNLHWSDEKIYQETRRIIGAMFQHITYREFLPIVLGREVCRLFELELLTSGYYEGYDSKTNPGVANSFAAAAFRFGHSLVQNSYMRCDRFHNVLSNNVSLHEEFQRGDIGSVGSLHRLIRGLANQRALQRDEFITPELTNHLFQTPGFPFGLDLAAINIQRGRDHGIPPYTHWRVPCGLSAINTWEEFANVVGPESARRISHAYQNVHDIDLFVGGIAERPVVGGLVGPTFACIIAQQFSNSRKGDRFWYENAGFESSFTPAQLHSIRKVTLASVLCRTVGGGTFQPHIFLPPDTPQNERLPCGVGPLAEFDLEPWLEQDPFASPKPVPIQIQTPTAVQIESRPNPTVLPRPPILPALLPQPPLPPPERPLNIPPMAHPPPTIEPPVLDRIFEIVQSELDTNAPIPAEFLNKRPPPTREPVFIPTFSVASGFNRFRNTTKINDKLDLKRKGITGHITKPKPLPGVSNKLDKHSRKGPHRQAMVETTTRRTIVVNNIPIELRHASSEAAKTEGSTTTKEDKLESRTADLTALTTEISLLNTVGTEVTVSDISMDSLDLEARTEDLDLEETIKSSMKPTGPGNNNIEIAAEEQTNLTNVAKTSMQNNVNNSKVNPSTNTEDDRPGLEARTERPNIDDSNIENHMKNENRKDVKEQNTKTSKNETIHKDESSLGIKIKPNETFVEDQARTKRLTGISNLQATDLALVEHMKESVTNEIFKDTPDLSLTDIINSNGNSSMTMTSDTSELREKTFEINSDPQQKENFPVEKFEELNSNDVNKTSEQNFNSTNVKNLDYKSNSTRKAINSIDNKSSISSLHSNDSDIDPLANSPSHDLRRVQRKLSLPTSTENLKEKLNLPLLKAVLKSNVSVPLHDKFLTTKVPKPSKTATVQSIELRQYQKRPQYPKPPHKVIVDTTNGAGQYEIEINIRQTNKSPIPLQSTPDYSTNYKSKPYDRYTNTYVTYPSTTPLYAYLQHAPVQVSQLNSQNQRTKPPTIIFLNEHEEHGTTTRQPGFVHSIVGWNSGSQRPLPPDSDLAERPSYDGVISRPLSGSILPSNFQNTRPGAVSSFSQAQVNGGVVQASSQATSNGHYGSITGFASANGADSTFSFNIRPKPEKPNINRPDGTASYGLLHEAPKPWYNKYKPVLGEQISTHEIPYREGIQTPFSTSNSQTYYIRKKHRPYQKEEDPFEREPEIRDHDYLSRTLTTTQNITALEEFEDILDGDYEYDDSDDYGNSPLIRKFNKDGYLRPELMLAALNKTVNFHPTTAPTTSEALDDNYVLPAMNSTKDIPKVSSKINLQNTSNNYPDSQSKQLNNDIFAEDLQEHEDQSPEDTFEDDEMDAQFELEKKKLNILKRHQEKISFAPITILTKPERPDNWVIYDSPEEEEPLLPQIPDLNQDLSPSAEIPKPIRENIWLSLAHSKKKLPFESVSSDLGNETELPLTTARNDNPITIPPEIDIVVDHNLDLDAKVEPTESSNQDGITDRIETEKILETTTDHIADSVMITSRTEAESTR
uniref:Uncharacterized protein n=1 Tax=Stomoxys calcitrans TaxID=35570 RepID=A0A1I8NM29_STOCA